MMFNPHKLGIHKVLKHIPLNAVFDAPYKRALKKAVNIADLRLIAKSRAHKVSQEQGRFGLTFTMCTLWLTLPQCCCCVDGV
jgi:hypothetical protein